MILQRASDVCTTPIDWLWPGYLAAGSLAILDGDPGQGKSLLSLDLAARLTTGQPWPDNQPSPRPASVLCLCTEDSDAVVQSRLRALNADLTRVYLWPRHVEAPLLPSNVHRLEDEVKACAAKLVIIDPIVAFLHHTIHPNNDADVRRALKPLAKLCETHGCAMLLIRHLNKKNGINALYRGGGSIAFVASCRLAWQVGCDPKMEERHVLAQSKNNYAPVQPSLSYVLPTDALRVAWDGSTPWTANELTSRRPQPARRRAREFLTKFLADGPRLAKDIHAEASKIGISKNTIESAKKQLRIVSERRDRAGQRLDYWRFEHQEIPPAQSATPKLDAWLKEWHELYPAQD